MPKKKSSQKNTNHAPLKNKKVNEPKKKKKKTNWG